MVRSDRATIVAHLVRRLVETGSPASSTHVRSCLFLLQEKYNVELGLEFVIRHYAPFSFELDSELAAFRRQGVLSVESNGGSVRYRLGSAAPELPPHLASAGESIDDLVVAYGGMAAKSLDVYATTYFVEKRLPDSKSEEIVAHVRRIKPHVSAEPVTSMLVDRG